MALAAHTAASQGTKTCAGVVIVAANEAVEREVPSRPVHTHTRPSMRQKLIVVRRVRGIAIRLCARQRQCDIHPNTGTPKHVLSLA